MWGVLNQAKNLAGAAVNGAVNGAVALLDGDEADRQVRGEVASI